MSQPAEPNPPASKPSAPTPAEFGAGAFEERPDREEPPTPSHDLAVPAMEDRVTLEANSLPPVIELPGPLAVSESSPMLAQPVAGEIDPVHAQAAASEIDPVHAQAAMTGIDPVLAQAEALPTSVPAPLLVESEPLVAVPSPAAATSGPIAPTPLVEPVETPRIEEAVPDPVRVERPVLEPVLAIEARPRVHEVEAVPVSRFEAPAPTIDVEARRAPPAPPAHAPESVPSQTRAPIAAGSSAAHEPAAAGAEVFAATAASASAEPPPPSPSAPPPPAPQRQRNDSASRWWSMVCHLFLFLAIPTLFLGGFLTLLVWLLAGRNDALVTENGREALNFQINVAIVTALLAITCIASPLIPVVWFVAGVFCVLAAVHAFSGKSYRYPYMLRIVRA